MTGKSEKATGRRGDGARREERVNVKPRPVARSPRRSAAKPRIAWRQILSKVWRKLFEDDVFGRSAQLAYYWLFSIFPLLIFLTTLLAFLPMRRNMEIWMGMLSNFLPAEAFTLLNNTFQQIVKRQRGGLLSFSVLVTLWSSSSGMEAIISSLNRAYDFAPPRAWWKERLLSVALTLGLALFIASALALIFFGQHISWRIAKDFGFS